jgi:hypothetical protein
VPLLRHLERRQFRSNEEVEMALGEWLRLQESSCNSNGVLTHAKVGENASMCLGIILRNN